MDVFEEIYKKKEFDDQGIDYEFDITDGVMKIMVKDPEPTRLQEIGKGFQKVGSAVTGIGGGVGAATLGLVPDLFVALPVAVKDALTAEDGKKLKAFGETFERLSKENLGSEFYRGLFNNAMDSLDLSEELKQDAKSGFNLGEFFDLLGPVGVAKASKIAKSLTNKLGEVGEAAQKRVDESPGSATVSSMGVGEMGKMVDKGLSKLAPNKGEVENILKPKTEIRNKGGFKFDPEKIKQNIQLQKVRVNKMNEGKTPAGEPLNERIEIKSPERSNLPNFVVGKIEPKDWQERTEKLLSDDQINRASKWYKEVYEYFNKIPGVEDNKEAKTLAQAWFAGQQNSSPSEALKNVLSIRQLLKEGRTPNQILNMEKIPYGGLEGANRAILSVLTDTEVKGVGQKISDFRDALDNKNVRSFMGDDIVGGQPFVVDIHTGRDTGLVDKTLLNFLEKKGYTIPKNIKTDFDAGVPFAKYENRSVFGNKLTEYLNSNNWKGRSNWEPTEIQAIGWTALTNFYGGTNTAGNITDALNINIQRISMEAKPGKGSPWDSMFGKDYSKLPIQKQTQINNEITDEAIKIVSKKENVDLTSSVFGTGGWQSLVNPSTIQQTLLTRDKAKIVAARLGMLLNQDEVWVNSVKGLTKNPNNMAIDIIEEGSVNFKDSKYINKMFTDLFEKTDGLIEGFQPIETLNNEVGIRIIITKEAMKNFGKKNKLTIKQVQDRIENLDINNLLKDYDFKMRYGIVESELDILSNNWKKNKDGTDYKKNYLQRGNDPRTFKDGKDFDLDRQKLTDLFRQKIRDAQGVKTPNEEIVEIIEDTPPINKKVTQENE